MTDRPKFEDYVNGPEGWTGDLVEVAADAWKACADAYEPIIAGLEKKLAEARAEIAGAYFAAANVCQDALKQMEHHAICKPERILALTPESARQAMEQRVAKAVFAESIEWSNQIIDMDCTDQIECNCWKCKRIKANRRSVIVRMANRAKAEGARKGESK